MKKPSGKRGDQMDPISVDGTVDDGTMDAIGHPNGYNFL